MPDGLELDHCMNSSRSPHSPVISPGSCHEIAADPVSNSSCLQSVEEQPHFPKTGGAIRARRIAMVVAAAVPVKFKRRKVSAVRHFPQGCGRNAAPAEPDQAFMPPESEGVLRPYPPPAAEAKEETVAEVNGAEGLLEQQVVKLEASELLTGSLDQPEVSKGSPDQPELLVAVARVDIAVKQRLSEKYPPPKRRKVSAARDFPAGCGRIVHCIIKESSEVATVADSSKSNSSDAEKGLVADQSLAADCSVGVSTAEEVNVALKKDQSKKIEDDSRETSSEARVKSPSASVKSKSSDGEKKAVVKQIPEPENFVDVTPTGKAKIEVKKDKPKKSQEESQETGGEARATSPSASLKNKSLDGKKMPEVKQLPALEYNVCTAPTEKAQGELRGNDAEQVGEKAQAIGGEAQVKSALAEECSEKILVRSTYDEKEEVHNSKPFSKSLPIKEVRESKASLDSRSQSGSKSSLKAGSSLAGKRVDKGLVKHQTDTKVMKRNFSEEGENKAHVTNVQTEGNWALDSSGDRMIVQALMAAQNCPWSQGRKFNGFSSRSVMSKKMKKDRKPSFRFKNEVTMEDEEDSIPHDKENEKALTVYNKPHESSVVLIPLVPPKPDHESGENNEISDCYKVKRALRLFQLLCRKLLQGEESKSEDLGRMNRVDLMAADILKKNNERVNRGKAIIGHVPGVEVGDEFHFRVELSIVGLHRPYQAGIDFTKKDGKTLATSIVASGGYPDDMDTSDVLVYSGSGGKPAGGGKQAEDQKLERGNLGLKNCIDAEMPVRVIRKRNERGSRAKSVSTFTYDGLYVVDKYWREKGCDFSVLKFRLIRMAGQPELALKEVKRSKRAKVREGLCIKDISEGMEIMPICAMNTIDEDRPTFFNYITENIYPSWYVHTPPRGCDCTDGCSDSERCACAVKNGGELPFNYNGDIVQAKPLVYECGPSCKCPPSCYNRVSQHGIKIPLEIFKTISRGWGVRSLYSIPSGSFICEYMGELLKDSEAEQRSNDEYLFDIGHNYEDKTLWEGLPSLIPGLQSSSVCETVEDVGFTIDASAYGNVGRFINHSCSPNIYAQNVLYDHDDKRMPHIMFFAADHIPPLQELTYHYNYTVDQVCDSEGNVKQKNCYCGAPECTGRLY